ncbi:hypothetical protein M758_1G103000 [Ceratodon purpureus]|nr:hypothetical protein M758_1G103000 [Ceratodon purpureus]
MCRLADVFTCLSRTSTSRSLRRGYKVQARISSLKKAVEMLDTDDVHCGFDIEQEIGQKSTYTIITESTPGTKR